MLKKAIIIMTIIYMLSPDLVPGPLDDIIIMVLGVALYAVVRDRKQKN